MEPELGVVIPIYRSAGCMEALHERLTRVLGAMAKTYEIIYVEDRGPDDSWEIIQRIALGDRHVRAFRLSRNFGQHRAITAGLSRSSARWTVVMDGDLEDPPEEIPRLYAEASRGYDVVFTRRMVRHHGLLRRLGSKLYYRLLSAVSGTKIIHEHGNLSILSRKTVNAFLEVIDQHRQYLLVLYWLGFKSSSIEYEPGKRYSGTSSYSLSMLISQVFVGMLFQTTVFLRWIVYLGMCVSFVGVCLAGVYAYRYLILDVPAGWTSLAVLQLVLGGFIIMSTGVAAVYVGRIFEQVKGRPLFVIDETIEDCVQRG